MSEPFIVGSTHVRRVGLTGLIAAALLLSGVALAVVTIMTTGYPSCVVSSCPYAVDFDPKIAWSGSELT